MTFEEFAGARLQAVLRFATALTGDQTWPRTWCRRC